MSLVTEIISTDQLNDLWRSGYTIVRRQSDPFEIDPKLIPRGMAYQWNSVLPPATYDGKTEIQPQGWSPVPFSRSSDSVCRSMPSTVGRRPGSATSTPSAR